MRELYLFRSLQNNIFYKLNRFTFQWKYLITIKKVKKKKVDIICDVKTSTTSFFNQENKSKNELLFHYYQVYNLLEGRED